MAKVINSFAISGINAYVVKIEVDTIFGQPSVSIVGLADISVKESRERLETSITNQKYEFPKMKIIFNLAPSDIKKSGSHFDLGMAIGLLIQDRQILVDNIENFAFIGELSLNGELRACSGVLPMAIEAKEKGIRNLIVPKDNFLDRIDIQKYVEPVNFMNLSQYKKGRASKELKELVERACKIQQERYSQSPMVNNNSQMTPAMINEYCKLDDQSKKNIAISF